MRVLCRLPCFDGRMKGHLDRVFTELCRAYKGHAVVAKTVLRVKNDHIIDPHGHNRVDHRQHQINVSVRQVKHPRCGPVPFTYPTQVVFVAPPIRIGDQACSVQCANPVAGQKKVTRIAPAVIRQRPKASQFDSHYRRASDFGSNKDARAGSMPTVRVSPFVTLACPSMRMRNVSPFKVV